MRVADSLETKVRKGLPIMHLDLRNESDRHNVPPGSETHFRLTVVSEAFAGLPRVRRHQQVYALVHDEMSGPVHALALHTYTADEWTARGGEIQPSPNCRGGSKNDPEFST